MDRQYIDDHHIVARYLADTLPDTEREAFEAYYLEHPEILQEMEAAARFKVGLMQLRDSGELAALLNARPWFRQTRYLATAASIAIVAIGALLFYARGPSQQPLLAATSSDIVDWLGNPRQIAGSYAILRIRGTSYDAEIELPASPQSIELRVLPEAEAQPPRYRIALASVADDNTLHPMAVIGGLAPADDGFVAVFLNTAKLGHGRYQLTLSGDAGTSAANDASTFRIRVKPPSESPPAPL